jgi:hypothetical protein
MNPYEEKADRLRNLAHAYALWRPDLAEAYKAVSQVYEGLATDPGPGDGGDALGLRQKPRLVTPAVHTRDRRCRLRSAFAASSSNHRNQFSDKRPVCEGPSYILGTVLIARSWLRGDAGREYPQPHPPVPLPPS